MGLLHGRQSFRRLHCRQSSLWRRVAFFFSKGEASRYEQMLDSLRRDRRAVVGLLHKLARACKPFEHFVHGHRSVKPDTLADGQPVEIAIALGWCDVVKRPGFCHHIGDRALPASAAFWADPVTRLKLSMGPIRGSGPGARIAYTRAMSEHRCSQKRD